MTAKKRAVGAFLALIAIGFLMLALAPKSNAATIAAHPAGISIPIPNPLGAVCSSKDAPVPDLPGQGLPGLFQVPPSSVAAPGNPIAPVDPAKLFQTSGFSGMDPITYDLGCGVDPATWGRHLNAWSQSSLSGRLVNIGQSMTAASNAVDAWAWDPSWIHTLLAGIASHTLFTIQEKVLLPFLGLALILCSVVLLHRSRRGNTREIASGVSWMLIVLLIGGFVVAKPTLITTGTQSGVGTFVSTLYNGSAPASAATDQITDGVHYQGWLRRTFGSSDSATARTYGPRLLADTRFTWAEEEATEPQDGDSQSVLNQKIAARGATIAAKGKDFKAVAAQIKASDPNAYEWLQGEKDMTGISVYEMAFAGIIAGFRIGVDLLLVLALLLLTIYGIVWVLAMPWMVLPQGERMGRNLIDNTTQAIGYVVMAAIGSWLFTIYTEVCMQPGWPTWSVFLLMGVGVFIFWTALRPDRKALALLTMGRVRGNGRFTSRFTRRLAPMALGGLVAGGVGAMVGLAAAEARYTDEERAEHAERRDEAATRLAEYHAAATPAMDHYAAPAERPLSARRGNEAGSSVLAGPLYTRPDSGEFVPDPVPPPPGTVGDVYTRPYDQVVQEFMDADNEEERP
jgi:hypothetical protein